MTRRTILLLVLLLIIFVASGYRDRADATEATISETHECLETGEWSIVWSVYNDDPRPLVVTDQDPVLWPAVIVGKMTSVAQPVILPGDAEGHSATIIGTWADGEPPAFLVGIVDLREETCTPGSTTTTTSSTTTSLPVSTTITVPPGSSTTVTTSTVPDSTTTSSSVPVTSTVPQTTTTIVCDEDHPRWNEFAQNCDPLPVTGIGDWAVPLGVAGFALVILGVLAIMAERRNR